MLINSRSLKSSGNPIIKIVDISEEEVIVDNIEGGEGEEDNDDVDIRSEGVVELSAKNCS